MELLHHSLVQISLFHHRNILLHEGQSRK